MHILICGHGYLGREVSRQLLEAGDSVTAVSRHEEADPPGDLDSRAADVASAESVDRLAAAIPAPDFIVHCVSSGRGGPEAYRTAYLDGARHLLAAFKDTPLLYTSSTSVYAQTDGSVVDERSPAEPDRETGRILRETEELVLAAGGFAFRLSGIYGPGRSVILRKFLAGESKLEEDGRRFLNQIHRDDAAAAVCRAAHGDLDPGIYNLSDSRPLAQIECFRELARRFGRPLPESVPRDLNRKRGWTHKQVSNAKLVAAGWSPRYPCFLDAVDRIAPTLEA